MDGARSSHLATVEDDRNSFRTRSGIAFAFCSAGSLRNDQNRLARRHTLTHARLAKGEQSNVTDDPTSQQLYHGTKADLKPGDLIGPGYNSNYGKRKKAAWVYLTATLDAATWGAELALGEAPGRIYIVQPTGPIEDDPNLTDKKFPGNPTKSYRSRDPLRVTGEVTEWQGHSAEQLQAMKDGVERARQLGIEAIEE